MLYYLFELLDNYNVPGAGLFSYISFRSALALITSLIISIVFGKRIIALINITSSSAKGMYMTFK